MVILRPLGRGFALAYFLIISAIIVMLTGSLLVIGQESLRATRSGVDANRALYAAEAGMTELIARLERDPSWTGTADNVTLPNNTGSYSYRFASSPSSATDSECVSNLTNDTRGASYRGDNTVPAHAALLVVTGRSGLSTRTVEALVVSGLNVEVGDALVASGRVEMEGDVQVDGRKSLTDPQPVEANMHTNQFANPTEGRLVSYRQGASATGSLQVSGRLTASCPALESEVFSISPDSGVARDSNIPTKKFPNPNIEAIVQDAREFPFPVPDLSGSEITLNGKNYYEPTDGTLVINGDVYLEEGAQLVVDGNLKINGSIYGRGQLVVGGTTEFYGDARVSFREEDYVSVLSGSHVVLKGFDGQAYLDEHVVAANPLVNREHSTYQAGIDRLQSPVFNFFYGGNPPDLDDIRHPLYPSSVAGAVAVHNLKVGILGVQDTLSSAWSESGAEFRRELVDADEILDAYGALVSYQVSGASHLGVASTTGNPSGPIAELRASLGGEVSYNNAGLLAQFMSGSADGTSRNFLEQRFRYIEHMFRIGHTRPDGGESTRAKLPNHFDSWRLVTEYESWEPESDGGLFDSMQSQPYEGQTVGGTTINGVFDLSMEEEKAVFDIVQSVLELNIDRLGSANFKGVIYTNGAFVATDDVVVRGSVFVDGNPTLDRLSVDGKSFGPGDVGLYGHTTLTFVEEFFEDGIHNLAGNGTLDIKRWTTR